MESRVRTRYRGHFGGGSILGPTSSYSRNIPGGVSSKEVCIDRVLSGPPPYVINNPLDLTYAHVEPVRTTGTVYAFGTVPVTFDNVPTGLINPEDLPIATPPRWDIIQTEALAKSNPNIGSADIGETLSEFHRLPASLAQLVKGVRSKGRDFLKRNPGQEYLAWKFGWLPLLSDLKVLISLSAETYDHYREVSTRMRKKKTEGKLPLRTSRWAMSDTFDSYPYLTTNSYFVVETTKEWWSGRYEQLDELPDPASLVAKLGTLGFATPSLTAWNILPWSWMVDYFSTLGAFLETAAGGIRYQVTDLAVMSQSTIQVTYLGNSSRWSSHGGKGTRVTKRRANYHLPKPRIRFHFPASLGQGLNLSALAIARSKLR